MHSPLLNYIYPNPRDIYLKSLQSTSRSTARATFVFGHNPRTSDYTHVGAAEMLAGISQAAYCLASRYAPELVKDDTISNCFFDKVTIKFSKMLAPQSEASLDIKL